MKCEKCGSELKEDRKATILKSGIEGLEFICGDDGVWLHFDVDGLHAVVNLNNYAQEAGLVGKTIKAWCEKTWRENYRG